MPEVLRASHIKPWADCPTDRERLDVFNGLLLAPNLDAVFDAGFVTIAEDGAVCVSPDVPVRARDHLGLDVPLKVECLDRRHERYLAWHRANVFRGSENCES